MAERKGQTGRGKTKRLTEYKAKRDFSRTPEPSGAPRPRDSKDLTDGTGRARFFCVQKHLASHLHYDFRLEHDGVLLSWAVPKGPSLNTKDKRLAMRVEDHPFDYGEFEGVIPEGYGAGIVMLWDKGTWEPDPGFENVDQALARGELKLRLNGVKLKGGWVIVRTGGRDNGESRTWLLIKHRDEWAGPLDVVRKFPLSVKSFGDFEDILAQDKPDVWESHRPAKGGEAGAMLQAIIERAAKLKAGKGAGAKTGAKTGAKPRSSGRAGGMRRPAKGASKSVAKPAKRRAVGAGAARRKGRA